MKTLTKKEREKRIKEILAGEIKWLKTHRNKLRYKHPVKLIEYAEHRIEFLEKLERVI